MVPLLFPGFLVYVVKFGRILVTYAKNLILIAFIDWRASVSNFKKWFKKVSVIIKSTTGSPYERESNEWKYAVHKYFNFIFSYFHRGPTGLGGARLQERKKPVKLISAARSEAVCSVARTFWLLMQSSEAAAATHAPPWSSLRPCRTPRLCTTIAGKSKFCPKIMRPSFLPN